MSELKDNHLSRRRFLGLMGATAALASGCSKPDRGAVVSDSKRPAGSVPGISDFYATTFQQCLDTHGVLVRTREGRPIHIEGNDLHPLSRGKAPLSAMADILRLYDPDRLAKPYMDGKPAGWEGCLEGLFNAVTAEKPKGKGVLLLTGALVSPTARALVSDLAAAVPGLKHAAWEPSLSETETSALKACYGSGRRPRLLLEEAKVLVTLEADLLSPDKPEQVAGFASRRTGRDMSRVYSVEAGVSLTGAKADHRFPWKPSSAASLAFALCRALSAKGVPLPPGVSASWLKPFDLDDLARTRSADPRLLQKLVEDLRSSRGSALVVAGPSLHSEAHAAAFLLNAMLGAEGRTLDASLSPEPEPLESNAYLSKILASAASGAFEAAVFWGADPAYAFPDQDLWHAAVSGIRAKAFIGTHADETAQPCRLILPANHWLESWNDFEPLKGVLSLQQPAIGPIFDTLQGEDILQGVLSRLKPGQPASYKERLMARWQREVYPGSALTSFARFWNASLHDGVLSRPASANPPRRLDPKAVAAAAKQADSAIREGFEVILSPSPTVADGRYANNGWLQELPHPMTKLSWGNAAAVSPGDARELGLRDGSLVALSVRDRKVVLPAVIVPGQAQGTVSSCLGYGRKTGTVARGVGVNLYPLLFDGPVFMDRAGVQATGGSAVLPFIQRHHKLEGRNAVRTLTLQQASGGPLSTLPHLSRLMPDQRFPGHKWAMAVDLGRCVGCQSCTLACQSENNVPVVGPERVLKGREMHWMRVDRYYEAGRVLFEPMLCQHCDDAPCETVCPVSATNHSPEGLNQMAYNRCVGTRYCSNNCPYKVRRFNFFEYAGHTKEPLDLAFNPEVTVRPRGVMEKCTFCVQRIDEAKAQARSQGRKLKDGDIVPACAAACPAGAIVFGDVNDPKSRISQAFRDPRGFRVLEELGIKPSTYLAEVTNPAEGHGA
ncbi:MAG: 4Fe-4S dicluster domain-containing protein [Elusimicrobiota bacterium]|jgi:molybdopterin-containing oxidoreductase family iron-sulfur binding subunit